jgi:hypothetical protein
MNDRFEPSPDFTERVMARVRACEAKRIAFTERIASSRPLRLALACGGTFLGVLGAAPAF